MWSRADATTGRELFRCSEDKGEVTERCLDAALVGKKAFDIQLMLSRTSIAELRPSPVIGLNNEAQLLIRRGFFSVSYIVVLDPKRAGIITHLERDSLVLLPRLRLFN
jgi:hypothetical protein